MKYEKLYLTSLTACLNQSTNSDMIRVNWFRFCLHLCQDIKCTINSSYLTTGSDEGIEYNSIRLHFLLAYKTFLSPQNITKYKKDKSYKTETYNYKAMISIQTKNYNIN